MAKPGSNKPKTNKSPSPAPRQQVAENRQGKEEKEEDTKKVSLFRNPIQTLSLFSAVLFRFLGKIVKHIVKHIIPYGILAALIIVPHFIHGPHSPFVAKADEIAEFVLYWIILGVASSIGLGTGLHTFVLYLGPHIAKITMVANECNAIPEFLPSRWAINPTFGECPAGTRPPISFFEILWQVQLESLLWGLGTALGELPPYFVALAASKAGKTSEELDELKKEGATKLIDKIKLIIYHNLQKYAFLTVLLCASIPNPLFDLAGITCGHFGIPFATFFGATAIGKSIIKVHLQMVFVILMFSHHHVENLLGIVERNVPALKGILSENLEKQKKLLHSPKDLVPGSKPVIAQLWDVFIFLMISYFVVSIIESLANGELDEREQEKEKKDKKRN